MNFYVLKFVRKGQLDKKFGSRSKLIKIAKDGMKSSLPNCHAVICHPETDAVVWEAVGSSDGIKILVDDRGLVQGTP